MFSTLRKLIRSCSYRILTNSVLAYIINRFPENLLKFVLKDQFVRWLQVIYIPWKVRHWFHTTSLIKVHSHICFKATYKLLIEQLASIPLVESYFLATFKLLCSIHVNVPLHLFAYCIITFRKMHTVILWEFLLQLQ
jgi:hypothetical protein